MAVTMRDSRALWLLTVLGIVGALYVAKAVFIPLALAVLLTFVLAPPARLLRQWGVPRIPAALTVVLLAFISIMGSVLALGQQLNQLASELPKYGNHPFSTAGGPIAFVLREQVSQIFHSGGA